MLVYLISIPLGVSKAVRDGSTFDVWSSAIVVIGNAVPAFLFAIALIVFFAGGRYFDWFPLRGLTSDNFSELSTLKQMTDYFWHMALPILSMVIGGFAGLTMLTKNSFIDEINKQYVVTTPFYIRVYIYLSVSFVHLSTVVQTSGNSLKF